VNIAAVMVVLDEWELDHYAKSALLVVCCRANRAGVAQVPIRRVAADMKANYDTARRALNRTVNAGYLTVDKTPGRTPLWRLTSRCGRDPTSRSDAYGVAVLDREHLAVQDRDLKILGEEQRDGVAASLTQGRAAPPGSNPSVVNQSAPTFAPGSGYLRDWTGDRTETPETFRPDFHTLKAALRRHPANGEPP